MIKKYSKTIFMMFSALMLIAVSMKANSTSTVGTADEVAYEASIEDSTLAQPLATSFSNGRNAGRAAGRAIRGLSAKAWLAAEAAYHGLTALLGGDEISNFDQLLQTDLSDFDQ